MCVTSDMCVGLCFIHYKKNSSGYFFYYYFIFSIISRYVSYTDINIYNAKKICITINFCSLCLMLILIYHRKQMYTYISMEDNTTHFSLMINSYIFIILVYNIYIYIFIHWNHATYHASCSMNMV